MHECEHGYACDCDGEDTWASDDEWVYYNCVCDCEEGVDFDIDEDESI